MEKIGKGKNNYIRWDHFRNWEVEAETRTESERKRAEKGAEAMMKAEEKKGKASRNRRKEELHQHHSPPYAPPPQQQLPPPQLWGQTVENLMNTKKKVPE